MKNRNALAALACAALAACASEPADRGDGKHSIYGYGLENQLERAKQHCGSQEMVTIGVSRPVAGVDWAHVDFMCR